MQLHAKNCAWADFLKVLVGWKII